jgi:ankyrin repeat protein
MLIELGCDVNLPSSKDKNSPLTLAAMRNKVEIVEILLEKGANPEMLNSRHLSCLDNAIMHCNYQSAFALLNRTNLQMKNLEEYLMLMQSEKTPLFNVPLFYQTLEARTDPEKIPFFKISKEQEKRNVFIHFRIRR